jgi:uncharacterized MnhB-related membrane protein
MTEIMVIVMFVTGVGFSLSGAVGIVRMPDVYCRIQCSSKTITMSDLPPDRRGVDRRHPTAHGQSDRLPCLGPRGLQGEPAHVGRRRARRAAGVEIRAPIRLTGFWVLDYGCLGLILLSTVLVVRLRNLDGAVMALSAVGTILSLLFVLGAPDDAHSEVVVGAIALPTLYLIAIGKVRTDVEDTGDLGERSGRN